MTNSILSFFYTSFLILPFLNASLKILPSCFHWMATFLKLIPGIPSIGVYEVILLWSLYIMNYQKDQLLQPISVIYLNITFQILDSSFRLSGYRTNYIKRLLSIFFLFIVPLLRKIFKILKLQRVYPMFIII